MSDKNISSNTNHIAAVVVLFYPETTKILRLLTSINGLVDSIILIDNSEQPEIGFEQFHKLCPNIIYEFFNLMVFKCQQYELTAH